MTLQLRSAKYDRIGPVADSTSPCWTCRASNPPEEPRPTCAPRSPGTSAPTPVRRSGCARRSSGLRPADRVRPSTICAVSQSGRRTAQFPVEDLIPRGYGSPAPIPRSSNPAAPQGRRNAPRSCRTGSSKCPLAGRGFRRGRLRRRGLVCLMPSGPHGVGYFPRGRRAAGSAFHPIDMDPRWVKKLTARNARTEVSAYVDHILEQARFILQTQEVGNLHTTPPLFEAIARDDGLVDLVKRRSATCCSAAPTWMSTPSSCCARSSRTPRSRWRSAAR